MVDSGQRQKASHERGAGPSFGDIVGQSELKRALLAVAANDDLDGLLVRGEKGTAKSTAVRALAGHLPQQVAVADCPYGCPPADPDRQCDACRERTDPPTVERPVPLVTLPLSATRERVVGTLSVADALAGDYEFDPGLLARANRGILYVDEVNLLDDHLVDVLLDAAADGVNRVERDGVSVSHPSEFTLVGTMNPEEGDLRPQLRDRFALQATVTACDDLDRRVEIIGRALGTAESVGGGRADEVETKEEPGEQSGGSDGRFDAPGERLRRARDRLSTVDLPTAFAEEIAELCREAGVDGHRGDIATARAARTFAALDDRAKVIEGDVRRAAELALPHRLRSQPFEDAPDPEDLLDEHFDDESDESESDAGDGEGGADREGAGEDGDEPSDDGREDRGDGDTGGDDAKGDREGPESERDDSPSERDDPDDAGDADDSERESPPSPRPDGRDGADDGAGGSDGAEAQTGDGDDERSEGSESDGGSSDEQTGGAPLVPGQSRAEVGAGRAPDLDVPDAVEQANAGGGTRSDASPSASGEGPRVRTRRTDSTERVDAAASVRAASARGASSVESRDLRQSVRRSDASALVVFAVDASASMRSAMRAAKGTVLELLRDAYQQRDEVAFVAFAGDEADVLLPPTDSVTLAARHLKELPTGDRTPLPDGLRTAADVVDRADPAASVVVLVTDGRANVAEGSPVGETRTAARRVARTGSSVVVVDAGDADSPGVTDVIADETDGDRVPLAALSAERVDAVVGAARETQL